MDTLKQVLLFLKGSKTLIASVALIIVPFLATQGLMTLDTASMITAIIGILTGTAKVTTTLLSKSDANFGKAILNK